MVSLTTTSRSRLNAESVIEVHRNPSAHGLDESSSSSWVAGARAMYVVASNVVFALNHVVASSRSRTATDREHLLEHQVLDEVAMPGDVEIVDGADLIPHRDLDLAPLGSCTSTTRMPFGGAAP